MKFPKRKQKEAEKRPTDTSERQEGATGTHNDRIYARLRRLEQRVSQIESAVSTARRDVNRIERASNRAKEAVPEKSDNGQAEATQLPDPYVR